MAISVEFAEKLSTGGGSKYFSLKNDKDFAMVRLMYNSLDEITGSIYGVHYTDDGKFECKRTTGTEPVSDCPLCQSGSQSKAVLFLNLYNIETKEILVWERTWSWVKGNIIPNVNEALEGNGDRKICEFPLKIVRNGASGDMKTTYNLFFKTPDGTTLDTLGERPNAPIKQIGSQSESNAPVADNSGSDLFRGM